MGWRVANYGRDMIQFFLRLRFLSFPMMLTQRRPTERYIYASRRLISYETLFKCYVCLVPLEWQIFIVGCAIAQMKETINLALFQVLLHHTSLHSRRPFRKQFLRLRKYRYAGRHRVIAYWKGTQIDSIRMLLQWSSIDMWNGSRLNRFTKVWLMKWSECDPIG